MSSQADIVTTNNATAAGKRSPADQKISIKLDRSISDLSWIQKSLLFAELSRIANAAPEAVENMRTQTLGRSRLKWDVYCPARSTTLAWLRAHGSRDLHQPTRPD